MSFHEFIGGVKKNQLNSGYNVIPEIVKKKPGMRAAKLLVVWYGQTGVTRHAY